MGGGGSAGIATGAVGAALALASPAAAAERFASPAGGGDCTSRAQACDIVTAIGGAAGGDSVTLLRGSSAPDYTVTTSLVPTFDVTIRGEAGGRRPVVQHIASGERALFLTDDLEHVELRRYVGSGPALEIAYAATARDVVVRNYAEGTAVEIGSGAFGMFGGTLEDSLAVASNANSQAVRSTGLGDPAVVRNVTALAPGAGSVAVDALENGQELEPGVCVAPVVGTLSARNVIARGGAADFATTLNGTCDAPDADATVEVGNSNYRAGAVIEQSGEVDESLGGNQTQPPDTANDTVFVDFSAGDYHQALGSPTIDAGLGENLGPTDFDGDARALEGGVDIGADEMIPPPPVSVSAPAELGQTFASLTGSADPLGRPLTASFEWGPTSAYGSVTPLQSIAGDGAQPVSAPLLALIPATSYHFRLMATATSANGEQSRSAVSGDQVFTTLAPPGPEPDSAAPNTRFTKRPKNRIRSPSARFSFAADEQGVRFQCRRDLGRWRRCSSPSRWARLRRGRHLFQVRAIDEAGNIDPTPAEDGFRVLRKKRR